MAWKGTVGVLLALIVLSSRGAAADPVPDNASRSEIERQFHLADKDGDGKLSRTEIQQGGWLAKQTERFDRIDRDGNGTLTLFEIAQAIAEQVRESLSADTDHDGRITKEEAQRQPGGLGGMFRRADANGDRVVTRDELERFSERSYYNNSELPAVAPNIIEKRF